MAKHDLDKQAKKILSAARDGDIEKSFLFITTFERYLKQLEVLKMLEEQLDESGPMVTKEYVKGRANVYMHPAMNEYNKVSANANNTVNTLIKIITTLGKSDKGAAELLAFIKNG